ncbi:MAG TPA: hypothetical protein VFR31_15570 [Thermoanaerobaculia bacterium]|nr:hypothetical protein [Thermoanaerobaculia bacterium]
MSWVCVGHPEPDRHVPILLNGEIDVSRNHAMVSLVPFLIAIRLDGIVPGKRPWLSVGEVGRVDLRLAREIDGIGLFETTGCVNRCLPAPLLHLHYLEQRWKLFRDRNPRNIKMAPRDLFCKFVLFTMPRPVVLVGHQRNGRSNLFPMDLVGEAGSPCFLLGLHRTSPAIPSMIEAGRLAVSAVPLDWKKTVFALGRNHREATVEDLSPVPEGALTVREVRIERTVEVGSHVLFITTTENLERRAEGLQMCHTHAFYQTYLKKSGRGLPEAGR